MTTELIVLSVNDGEIFHVDSVKVPEKQKRIRALRDWIAGKGKDGMNYRLAKFVTPTVQAEETTIIKAVELPFTDPKPKKEKPKPEAVEA